MSLLKVQRLRDAVTKTAKMLARDKVEIRQRGGEPHVKYRPDGSVEYVNLPMIPENPTPEYMNAMQGFLDHEVAHVLFTDNLGYRAVIEKAVREEGFELDKLKTLQNIFEDVRIESLMKLQFQGSAYNLSRSLDHVLQGPVTKLLADANKIANPAERTAARAMAAFVAWTRALVGDTAARLFMDENNLWDDYSLLGKAMPDLAKRLTAMKSSVDAATLAVDFMRAITPPPPPPSAAPSSSSEEDGDPEPGDEGGDQSEDEDGEAEDGTDEKPKLGDMEDGTNEGDDDEGDDDEGDDDEGDDGEGAGGGDDDTDSEKHKADDKAPEDATPDDHKTDGDADPEDDGDGDKDGEWTGDEDYDGGVDEEAEGKTNRSLSEAMRLLDPTQRKLITDYNKRRKSVEQIASERGDNVANVASELRDARRNLKRFMKGAK